MECQKICDGPVVGTKVEGHLEWFARVDSPKSREALKVLVNEGILGKPLENRRKSKRSGKLR